MNTSNSLAFARMPRAPDLRSSATAEGGEARGASLTNKKGLVVKGGSPTFLPHPV